MANVNIDDALTAIRKLSFPLNLEDIDDITQAFRTLRNHCAKGNDAQNYTTQDRNILTTVKLVLSSLMECSSPKELLCLNVALQFLANSLVDNKGNQKLIWEVFSCDIFEKFLKHTDAKVLNCTAMILYNILFNNEDILLSVDSNFVNIIELTQNEQTSEYAVFILELLVSKTDFVPKHFEHFSHANKMIILSIIHGIEKLSKQHSVSYSTILFLAHYFVKNCQCIVESASNGMEASFAEEVAKVLEVINSVSSLHTDYVVHLQTVGELLVAGVGLLRTVHALSKEKGNEFSMLLKMADMEEECTRAMENHPGFGFKAGLVRLIGNMCWHNKEHQDTARELGAIPLILDCCNIDARNPLIIQWAVLAMRNLCENNMDNQRVVASVDQKGEIDRGRLAELGLLFNGAGN